MSVIVDIIARHVSDALVAQRRKGRHCLTVGLCGSQGSGKSTAATGLAARFAGEGLRVATLSLDDLYLTLEAREALAATVHPLLRARGVPGTHDVALGERVIEALVSGAACALPRFDKARDTRAPEDRWPIADPPVDLILFEGWCVGARPQAPEALVAPINALERDEDGDGRWRGYANDSLARHYGRLFGAIDTLVLLAAPDFEVVVRWRQQQEAELRTRLDAEGAGTGRTMDDAAVARFVQHYERLTRHILAEMPGRAQLTVRLDADRRVREVSRPDRAA